MKGFEYYNPAKIIFGKDSLDALEEELTRYHVRSLLLIYSGEFIKDLGIYNRVKEAAKSLNITFSENGNVVPNPSVELVRTLVEEGRNKKVDFILAVGGGSSIDTAKAVALGIPYEKDVWDFFDKGVTPNQVLPVGVIPTIASSGSETSNAAIISNGPWKLGFEDDRIIPKFAIVNPEFTLGLPRYQTVAGIADVSSHLLERYFSDEKNSDTTDYLIEGALKALLLNGKRLVKLYDTKTKEELLSSEEFFNAKSEVQWLAIVAHNNFLDAGRSADWASHRIEHELSAEYNITHGEGMAVVILAWIRYMAKEKPWRPALLAQRVFGVDGYNYSEEEQALLLAEELERFYKALGLATSLKELEIDEARFEEMAKRATRNGSVGHYLEVNEKRFKDILKVAV